MRILIAPDKFKGALDATGVADALAAGCRDALPSAQITCCPMADGGEGSGALLAHAAGAEQRTVTVRDPLGRERAARWWFDPPRRTAIVEMAEASGLWLLDEVQRDATQTSSFGTGELIRQACVAGARHVTLCVGGSATVDGGAGCLQALGWELVDRRGAVISEPASGSVLARVANVRPPKNAVPAAITILCDVTNPLLGENGAAPVFAPQKGASSQQVRDLEMGLQNWARVLQRCTGKNPRAAVGGGAAGGLPAGLFAACDARLVGGFDEIARRVGLRAKFEDCDLTLTGEGRIDEQTVGGKVVAGVARIGADRGVPVAAFAGQVRPITQLAETIGLRDIVAITPPATPLKTALSATAANLRRAAADFLRSRGSCG